jgi:malonate transporter
MDIVAQIIVPVFGVVALGYAATFTRVFDEAAARGLSVFVFHFALPVALFRTMATTALPADPPLTFLAAYYSGTALMFAPALLLARGDAAKRVILGFGCAYSNSVLLGIPLIVAALGQAASVPLFLLIAFHSPLFFTAVTVLIEAQRGSRTELGRFVRTLATALATNVVLVTVMGGLAFNLLELSLPGPVDRAAEYLGRAAFPAALFSMGASLRRYKVAGALGAAALVVAAKLLVHPLVMAGLVLVVFEVPPLWAKVAILTAALPTGINVYMFATRYGVGEAESTTAILLSNVASLVTIAVVLALLGVEPATAGR